MFICQYTSEGSSVLFSEMESESVEVGAVDEHVVCLQATTDLQVCLFINCNNNPSLT